jgi:cyd operon protein YbgT
MWYFSWMLGLALACSFAILNALWFELDADLRSRNPAADSSNVS